MSKNEAFIELNGVRTKVATWGRWIEESPGNTTDIIILIPGNPGVVTFYHKFAKVLHEKTEIPVWCLGHAGHNFPSKTPTTILPEFSKFKQLYGLKGQIDHKVEFFNKYVPNDARVYLIGHSIGSYMILEALKDPDVKRKVAKAYLLFPTVERMASTRNGRFLTNFVLPIVQILLFLTWIFTVLPNFFVTILLYIYTFAANVPYELHANSIKELLKPGILRRVFYLADEEMHQVQKRDDETIHQNVDILKFYYGKTDYWAPEEFYNDIKRDIPKVDAELCDINHAFVFHHSAIVAATVADWIKQS